MAEAYVDPSNGVVALPSGHGADFGSMDINETQQTESVASYNTGTYDPHRGSGAPHQSVTVGGFAKHGAAGRNPGFGAMSAAGGAATFTIDTGVTLAGDYVVSQIRLQHARLRAAVPLTFQLENAGDVTPTWPVGA